MNCEKCKNKKATLFYADENGRRHALCVSCGALLGKAVSTAVISQEDKQSPYLPATTLYSLASGYDTVSSIPSHRESNAVCRGCGMTSEELCRTGEVGCPECYDCFGSVMFPALPTKSSVFSARMPYARRQRLDRERLLTELRVELRRAVESENFELAATVRDKIRNLEKQ